MTRILPVPCADILLHLRQALAGLEVVIDVGCGFLDAGYCYKIYPATVLLLRFGVLYFDDKITVRPNFPHRSTPDAFIL